MRIYIINLTLIYSHYYVKYNNNYNNDNDYDQQQQ